MARPALIILLLCAALRLGAQSPATLVRDYQRLIRSDQVRIRIELKVTDTLFFDMVDTLSHYCADPKFSLFLQIQNLKGLHSFLKTIDNREQVQSGQSYNLLLFYFSIIDWRKQGNYYDNLNSYSTFAMKCAAFFSEDSTGIKFIYKQAVDHPDDILVYADQLSGNIRYRAIIEDAIIKDPDFAKRYFYSENTVSYYAANSKRKDVQDIFSIFESYGTKSKAFILYDAVRRHQLTPPQADLMAKDNTAMIAQLVSILNKKNPAGLLSVTRELDYRATYLIRRSSELPISIVADQFSRFTTDEKFALLVFGYRECSPKLLDLYLSLLYQSDVASIDTVLFDNLESSALPAFLRYLDRNQRLSAFLSITSDPGREKLSRMLASDENEISEPLSLESIARKGHAQMTDESTAGSPEPMIEKTRTEPIPTAASATMPKKGRPIPPPLSEAELEDKIAVEPIHMPLSDSSRDILSLKRNIYVALQDISAFIYKPYAKDLLLYAAYVEPDEVLKKVDMYKNKYWSKEVLEAATLNAPLSAKRYFNNPSHPVTAILSLSHDPMIRKLMQLSQAAKYESRPFLLFDEMASGRLSLTDATALCQNNDALFKELMNIAAQKNYIGRYNVEHEMNYYALRYIRAINDKMDLPDKQRFASIESLSCDEIYYLMVYGREEVFDATFHGLFARFVGKCPTSGYWTAAKFVSLPHYRSFIAMCAAYGKLDKFLALFAIGDQNVLLTTFASSLDRERDELSDAATVAETLTNTSNSVVLQVLQNTIKASYLRLEMEHDYNGMAIYGILSALYKDKAVSDRKWFAVMAKKYKVGSLTTLTNAALMSPQNMLVERMYFYDDPDGRDSYKNFLATFTASPYWKVDEYFSYARITSRSGKKIEIYANKPELEESGDREITSIIRTANYTIGGIVHRGHSFHTETTLERVPASTRFLFVGSCGGFYKINIALRKAPDAQVISTRQVGVKEINDPLIFSFNEYVRQGKDISWKTFWDEMHARLGSNSLFNDYVPPHKNLESLFVRAYYQIMGNE
jgi:hypothetical protein